jgi:hypothetical protein
MNIKKTVIALTLASSLAIGAGAALAQDDTTPPTTETQPGFRGPRGNFGERGPRGGNFGPCDGFRGGPRGGFGVGAELIEEYTGLDRAAIREAHMNGQTLAELIEANGQSVDNFIAAGVAAASERIDEAVANDRITETVAAEMKAQIEERLTAMVNGERPQWMPPVPAEEATAEADA